MKETKEFLRSINMPEGDNYNLPDSNGRFSDGGQYRFEVPGIQNPGTMKTLLEEISRLNLRIHRVTQTQGIMMLTDAEILEMVSLANEYNVELVMAIGPRATYDTSASVQTPEGSRMGYRLRGQDQVNRGVEEVKRANQLGVGSFLIYDEGLLWLLNKMRNENVIPRNIKFKVSAHSGHGNPCSMKLLEEIGADSVNPVRDYQLQMLSSIRDAIEIPIDVHTENPKSSGGFIRHYEVPEIVRVASPVYLKTGGSVAKNHSWDTTEKDAIKRAKQVQLVQRMLDVYYPTAVKSK